MTFATSGSMDVVRGLKAVGVTPRFATIWLGPWTRIEGGKVPDLAAHIAACKAEGVLPSVQFFDAGDQITQAFFDGTVTTSRGANLAQWWALVKAIGATFGTQQGIVNLELEWFKGTIADGAPKFDQAWSDAAHTIRGLAPNVKISNCPGEWCPSERLKALFPKMVAATDIWATQNLRGLTRDSVAKYAAGPDNLLSRLKDYRAAFPGKALMVTDLAYSTYGGAFSTAHPFPGGDPNGADMQQKAAFDKIAQLRPQFESIGVTDVIIRSLRDVNMDDAGNYYGAGEDCWGLVRRDGVKKPAYPSFLAFAQSTLTAPDPLALAQAALAASQATVATQAARIVAMAQAQAQAALEATAAKGAALAERDAASVATAVLRTKVETLKAAWANL